MRRLDMKQKEFARLEGKTPASVSSFLKNNPEFRCKDSKGIDAEKVRVYVDNFLSKALMIQTMIFDLHDMGYGDYAIAKKIYKNPKVKLQLISRNVWLADSFRGVIPKKAFHKNIEELYEKITKLHKELKNVAG